MSGTRSLTLPEIVVECEKKKGQLMADMRLRVALEELYKPPAGDPRHVRFLEVCAAVRNVIETLSPEDPDGCPGSKVSQRLLEHRSAPLLMSFLCSALLEFERQETAAGPGADDKNGTNRRCGRLGKAFGLVGESGSGRAAQGLTSEQVQDVVGAFYRGMGVPTSDSGSRRDWNKRLASGYAVAIDEWSKVTQRSTDDARRARSSIKALMEDHDPLLFTWHRTSRQN